MSERKTKVVKKPKKSKRGGEHDVTILVACREHVQLMKKLEYKGHSESKSESDGPTSLKHVSLFKYEPSSQSLIYASTLHRMFGDKIYRFKISSAFNMSSSGSGAINSTISNSAIISISDFVNLTSVFNEFYIAAIHLVYQPVSLANGPLGFTNSTQVSSLPIGVASLQHGQSAFSNLAAMTESYSFTFHNTGKAFSYTWHNIEKRNDTTTVTSTVDQGWCRIADASSYTGTVQFISQSAPPGLPLSQVVGVFYVSYDTYFRVRL